VLVDLDIEGYRPDQLERLSRGYYLLRSHMAPHELLREGWYEFSFEWPEMQGDTDARLKALSAQFESGTWFSEYGSCDSPGQLLAHRYGRIIQESPHRFLVTFHHMSKADHADYRFHKNGPYIGSKRQGYEHLGDEPNITGIYQFQVYRQKETTP
jgi:hypothetical protein